MAEVAAGAAAYEAASTVVQAGVVAGAALAQSTQPLHGTFTRFAVAPDGDGSSSLARSKHTITTLHGKLYIFGGETSPGTLASSDMHILSLPNTPDDSGFPYRCIPPVPLKYTDQPPPALLNPDSCAIDDSIFIFNGSTADGEQNLRIWEFKTTSLKWRETSLAENARLARMIASGDRSLLPQSARLLIASTEDATYVLDQTTDHVDTLFLLDSHEEGAVFKTIRFPASNDAGEKNILPQAREAAKVVPVTTGHGRNYLLLLPGRALGAAGSAGDTSSFLHDIWALQLPSTPTTASKLKDRAHDALDAANVPGSETLLGGDSGAFSWAKVEVEARNEEIGAEGKSLPGPLAWYGADVVKGEDGAVVLWGGEDAKGERTGEGWILKVK